ncbi:MAG: pitrilysin family protein [bacterium]
MKALSASFGVALACAATLGCGGQPEVRDQDPAATAGAAEKAANAIADAAAKAPDRKGLPTPAGERTAWAPPAVTTWKTDNGITVWYLRQQQAPLVSLRLVLPTGAASDPIGKAGATSLMVDLLDEGAGEYTALTLGEAFQRLATDYGASTATDGIVFGLDMLADKVQPSLALLADVLRRPKLTPEEFKRRKDQHLAAMLAEEADPQYGASVVGRKILYGTGYGGMPASGVRGTLEKVSLDDVKARYKAAIQPQGATLIVVGAIERPAVEAAIAATLGDWSGEPVLAPRALTGEPAKRAVYWVDYPGSAQSVVAVVRRTEGTAAADYFPAEVLNRALGGAFTSRLNLNLREDKGYTYGARSYFSRWAQAGFFGMFAKVKAETTRASLDEMFKELDAVVGPNPIADRERDEAVGGFLLGFPGRFENMAGVAEQLATLVLDDREAEWLQQWPGKMESVELDAVREAAKSYGGKDAFRVVIAGDYAAHAASLDGLGLEIVRYDRQGFPEGAARAIGKSKGAAAK